MKKNLLLLLISILFSFKGSAQAPSCFTFNYNVTNASCDGNSDGAIISSLSGGFPPYSYNWSSTTHPLFSATTENIDTLLPGTYYLSVTDSVGCTELDSVIVGAIDSNSINQITSNFSINPVETNGIWTYTSLALINIGCDVNLRPEFLITLDSASITQGDLVVQWLNPLTGNYANLPYSINSNGNAYGFWHYTSNGSNPDSSGVLVSEGATQTLFLRVKFTVPANYGLYSCIWNTQEVDSTGNIIQTLAPADTITLNYSNCSLYTIDSLQINDITCFGSNDGNASVISLSGGFGNYSYQWSNGDSLQTATNLSAGNYYVVVTDLYSGCQDSINFDILEPDSLYFSILSNNISCNGFNDGNVSFIINGGTPPYYENWGASNPLALTPGIHYFTVSDTNGCSISDSVNINEPSEIIVTVSSTDIICYGGNNGTATLTISGGVSPYFEDWFGYDPTALFAGTYTYTVTDTNNCFITDSITIVHTQDSITSTLIPNNLSSCLIADGSINQSIIGGAPPYTYLWNNGDTTKDVSNLMAGTYSVTTTDTNGCFTTATIFVDQPSDSLRLNLSTQNFNGFNIACYGDTNGTISAITSGGYGLLSYNWSNGDTTSIANNLYAGSFSVTVTDTAGCSLTDSTILIEPIEFTSNYSTTDVLCYSDSTGSAVVTFNGGIPDYLLAWGSITFPLLNGQNIFASGTIIPQGLYPYSATDLNGCTIYDTITINQPDSLFSSILISDYNGFSVSCEGEQDAVVSLIMNGGTSPYNASLNSTINFSVQNELDTTNVPISFAGTYDYIISDNNGCILSDSITLTEPPRLSSFSLLLNNVSCYDACDGALTVLASGGISPYNYIWNNDSTQISDTAINLCAGYYTVQVLDANNCISNSIDSISQPNQISIDLDSITNNSVYGGNIGNIYITLNDTSSSVQYIWSGPNGFTSNSEDIVNLYAGTYILNTTDSLACSLDTFFVEEPISLSASINYITNNICWGRNQGAIAITADGGDSVYTYLWSGPNGFTSTDEDIDSLYAGIYTLELSDTTNTISYSYTVLENDEIIIFSSGATAICDDGSATATAYGFGGTPPLNTYWSNGDTGISTTLAVGTHAVTVIDVYGCSSTDSVTIEPGDSLSLFPNSTMISCYGLNDGIVEVLVTNGGTAPYQYSDDGGLTYQSSNTFYNLSPGNNTFTVLDNNGCSNDITTLITQPLELGVDVIFTNLQCFNDCDATATTIVDNGTQPYSYEWTDPSQQLNQTAINLCAGSYNVTVTDANGCVTTGFVSIVNPDPIIVNVWQYENMLEATSGFVSYQWLDDQGNPISGENSNEFFPTSVGEYSVEVTDSNGCTMISLPIYYNYTGLINTEISFNIYPNPASSTLYINGAAKISEVEIYNALGDKVIHHQNEYSAEILEFDLSNKTRGIYFVKIISGKKLINYKIVLQ